MVACRGRAPRSVVEGMDERVSTGEGDHVPWTETKERQRAKGTKDFERGNGRCLLAGETDQGACTRERMMVVCLENGPINRGRNGRCLLAGETDKGACTRERMMVVCLENGPINRGSDDGSRVREATVQRMMELRWGR